MNPLNKDLPWSKIELSSEGKIQGRLVDLESRWTFYWASTIENPWMLAMEHSFSMLPELPKYQGLSVENREGQDGNFVLLVRLENDDLMDIFHLFCLDLIRTVNLVSSEKIAVDVLLREIRRWHRLLNGLNSQLTFEEEQGLVGELHVLSALISRGSAVRALDSWVGPLGGAKDFSYNNFAIEVKSLNDRAGRAVSISSEYQLALEGLAGLHLVVVKLSNEINGSTLNQIVQDVSTKINDTSLEARFNTLLGAVGYTGKNKKIENTWRIIDVHSYLVNGGFPSISVDSISKAISTVKYKIDLDECKDFASNFEYSLSEICGELYD